MKTLFAPLNICLVPFGVGVSLTKYVVVCERVFKKTGLAHHLHVNGTNVEGEWDDVFRAFKRCHEQVHTLNVVRIHISITLRTRTDKGQTMQEKVNNIHAS